ncbi:hypothetical protein HZB94_03260 [Candidatus Falkowbacteria bacterium]|nr:hypothetical protein [Candidatus Falkowbacteria bacterium]
MCAGISFFIDKIEPNELNQFFTRGEFEKQRRGDLVETFFWQDKPFLPVEEENGVHLYHWGNREKLLRMPKTGWAKFESVQDGAWDWLAPKMVKVASAFGYEKRKWFKTPQGLRAIKVRYHNIVRVYMLTRKASSEFVHYIGHDRMPMGEIILPRIGRDALKI